jgi:hypothetical protein
MTAIGDSVPNDTKLADELDIVLSAKEDALNKRLQESKLPITGSKAVRQRRLIELIVHQRDAQLITDIASLKTTVTHISKQLGDVLAKVDELPAKLRTPSAKHVTQTNAIPSTSDTGNPTMNRVRYHDQKPTTIHGCATVNQSTIIKVSTAPTHRPNNSGSLYVGNLAD